MQFRKDAYSYDDLPDLPSGITEQLVASNQVPVSLPQETNLHEGKGK
jgi:hypothetical protein